MLALPVPQACTGSQPLAASAQLETLAQNDSPDAESDGQTRNLMPLAADDGFV